ncbi:hypothetical protein SAMN05216389_106188 [Oceanobacillus limi]|uniref:Uncharacterized protein n=1 Tax=Oceanobacillus limi TaxID=930131 RepID=A0A1I0CEA2_9BACI|nr:hypothetical protein [Oceanobacillus limi]SET17900.1 hypothetical protein SAMN05216389_106188 [Oceanobacillus limi]
MPLEQGVIELIIVGVSIFIGISVVFTLYLWIKNRNLRTGYLFVLLHFVIFSFSIYFLIKAISFDYMHPMASEEISLEIGISGVLWAGSIVCLIYGIMQLSKR